MVHSNKYSMKSKILVFMSHFPDDQEEKDNEIVSPSGKNLMDFFAVELHQRGFSTSGPFMRHESAWELTVENSLNRKRVAFYIVLSDVGYFILTVNIHFSIRWKIWKSRAEKMHSMLLNQIDEIVSKDKRLNKVAWFDEKEFSSSAVQERLENLLTD